MFSYIDSQPILFKENIFTECFNDSPQTNQFKLPAKDVNYKAEKQVDGGKGYFVTKQCMFWVFAIDVIPRYR